MNTTWPPDCSHDFEMADSLLNLKHFNPKIGIILGTGWNTCANHAYNKCSLSQLPSFQDLPQLAGHARELMTTRIGNKNIIVLNGRIHLNESPCDPTLPTKVRLQTELLCKTGIKLLIITNAAGRLRREYKVGDVVIAKNFSTLFAPPMPLWCGEFVSPDSAIVNIDTIRHIHHRISPKVGINTHIGCYAMVRGPYFEGSVDKQMLGAYADAVGMSTIPEACVAALHGVKVISLSFISNTEDEHSHSLNVERANRAKNKLYCLLKKIIREISYKNL